MLRKPSIRAVQGLIVLLLTVCMTAVAVRSTTVKKYENEIRQYENALESARLEMTYNDLMGAESVEEFEKTIADLNEQLDSANEQLDSAVANSGSVSLDYNFTRAEVDLLARLCQAEAGPENYESQKYVLHVVLNRIASEEFPNTVEEVVYQKYGGVYQFSVVPNGMIDTEATAEVIQNIKNELLYQEISIPSSVLYFHSESIDPKVNRRVYKRVEGTTFTY